MPTFTLFMLLPSEDFTNLKLQASFQALTIGFTCSNGHYNQPFKFFLNLKLNTQLTSINESLKSLNPRIINEQIQGS